VGIVVDVVLVLGAVVEVVAGGGAGVVVDVELVLGAVVVVVDVELAARTVVVVVVGVVAPGVPPAAACVAFHAVTSGSQCCARKAALLWPAGFTITV
jgi:hypothetical protein